MTGQTSAGVPRRRKPWPLWLAALVTVVATIAVVSIGIEVWSRSLAWPPFVTPGDALAIVIRREGLLPGGATCRGSGKAWAFRVFGVRDLAAQDRLIGDARQLIRARGEPGGFDALEIEFWSGEPPPPGGNVWTEAPRAGSAVVRTVKVP